MAGYQYIQFLKENIVIQKVNINEKLAAFSETWRPKIIGELNGQQVKVAKLLGEFVWHHHDHEDELFLVIKGRLVIRLKGEEIQLTEGEFLIIPKGVEHQPVAEKEVQIMLFEPIGTLNTGNIQNERTIIEPPRI